MFRPFPHFARQNEFRHANMTPSFPNATGEQVFPLKEEGNLEIAALLRMQGGNPRNLFPTLYLSSGSSTEATHNALLPS